MSYIRKYKKILLGVTITVIILGGFFIARSAGIFFNNPGALHVLELREDGFYPDIIRVRPGDTIRFVSKTGDSFWPASDVHPTHAVYPTFDPKRPLLASEAWDFKFEKIGRWAYHDHLKPFFQGVIEVSESAARISELSACRNQLLECANYRVIEKYRAEGTRAAFEELRALINEGPSLRKYCHYLSHNLGFAAYASYARDPEFTFIPEMQDCSFGFYHGFGEAFYNGTEDLDGMLQTCIALDKKLHERFNTPEASAQCYRAIGHAVSEGIGDPETRNNPEKIVAYVLPICERMAKPGEELQRCVSAIYKSIDTFYLIGTLPLERSYYLSFCRKQPAQYKDFCYSVMTATLFDKIGRQNLKSAVRFGLRSVDEGRRFREVWHIASEAGRFFAGHSDAESKFRECMTLKPSFRRYCIRGFVLGSTQYGVPGREYETAVSLCQLKWLPREYRSECTLDARDYLKDLYGRTFGTL